MKKAPLIVFLSIVKEETIKSMIFFPVDYVNPFIYRKSTFFENR